MLLYVCIVLDGHECFDYIHYFVLIIARMADMSSFSKVNTGKIIYTGTGTCFGAGGLTVN